MNFLDIFVRPIRRSEEQRYKKVMQEHHYLGFLPKIGETIWYVALYGDEWVGILSFSAAALKCAVRDQWIGWDFRHQYDRLKLLVNNSRFLILPDWHVPNMASRILSLSQKRLCTDWQDIYGHPVLLMETFVDPSRFQGTIYKASNWTYVGNTKGFRRIHQGYTEKTQTPKMVFVKPLQSNAQKILSQAVIEKSYHSGGRKLMLKADQMQSLPYFFNEIPDPRRTHGRRHRLSTILAIASGATLCGMKGYKAISTWAKSLGQKARGRFGCRFEDGKYIVPSGSVIRDVLVRVSPEHIDLALERWNETYAEKDESLAIDGKTMCNAIDKNGHQTHIMSLIGHETKTCHTQKKSVLCR